MMTGLHPTPYGTARYAGQHMTKADFLRWESDDNYVYEFSAGTLHPTTGLKQNGTFVLNNLEARFFRTGAFGRGGRLRAEVDVWVTDEQLRRPDIAYFSQDQFIAMSAGSNAIPLFVVELVSEYDDPRKYIRKLHEYFEAGVQNVWLVLPEERDAYVCTSPKNVTIYTDDDVLTATPTLSGLQLTVNDLL